MRTSEWTTSIGGHKRMIAPVCVCILPANGKWGKRKRKQCVGCGFCKLSTILSAYVYVVYIRVTNYYTLYKCTAWLVLLLSREICWRHHNIDIRILYETFADRMTFDCVVFLPVAELYGAEYMHIERVYL